MVFQMKLYNFGATLSDTVSMCQWEASGEARASALSIR